MSPKDFFIECNRREVFKRLSIYVVSSWVILQVLSIIWQPLGLPEQTVAYLIIILLVGFPLYLVVLWKSRVKYNTNDGDDSDELSETNQRAFKRMYLIFSSVISMVAALSVFLIFSNNLSKSIKLPTFAESNKIAVLNFENYTGDESLDIVGKMTADWLIHGITENQVGEVISSDVVTNYSNILGVEANADESTNILSKFLNPNKVVTGEIFLNGSTLLFNCTIKDVLGTKTFISFAPVTCDVEDSLKCIEELRQEVVGYLASKDKTEIIIENKPPKFKAYEKLLDAYALYDDPEAYINLLNESISLDDDFLTPKVDRIQHYYNQGHYTMADSLLNNLTTGERFNKQQQNVINFLKALLAGENDKVFKYYEYDFNLAPFDIYANSTYMTLALNYVNKPELVEDIYDQVNKGEWVLENCEFCKFRYFTMAAAYNRLGKYKKAIKLLKPVSNLIDNYLIHTQLVTAYVNSNQLSELDEFLIKQELESNNPDLPRLLIYTGRNFLLRGDKVSAQRYFDKVINTSNYDKVSKANAYYFKDDFSQAETLYEPAVKEYMNNAALISRLAVSRFKNGKIEFVEELIAQLDSLVPDYDFGKIDYCKAQYYAAIGQNERALSLLTESIAKGNVYDINTFQNDTHFISIKDSPQFKKILTYWHE